VQNLRERLGLNSRISSQQFSSA